MIDDTAPRRPVRVNRKGQHVSVPTPDLNPARLALKPFSWDRPGQADADRGDAR